MNRMPSLRIAALWALAAFTPPLAGCPVDFFVGEPRDDAGASSEPTGPDSGTHVGVDGGGADGGTPWDIDGGGADRGTPGDIDGGGPGTECTDSDGGSPCACDDGSDGVCPPSGCDDDPDCVPSCGNGVVEPSETCDIGIDAGMPGACPAACDDGSSCTIDTMLGAGCSASCTVTEITMCVGGDGCCPSSCTDETDSDCGPTVFPGGNTGNQTWTRAASPYIVEGDVIVQAGATLTLEPGVVVQFAGADALQSGRDPQRIELTVRGTLIANGTPEAPIVLETVSSGTSHGLWYGVEVEASAASASISHATIRNAALAVRSDAAGTRFSLSNTHVSSCDRGLELTDCTSELKDLSFDKCFSAIYVNGGAPSLTNIAITNAGSSAAPHHMIFAGPDTGPMTMTNLLISFWGIHDYRGVSTAISTGTGVTNVMNATIVGNSEGNLLSTSGALNVTNSILIGGTNLKDQSATGTVMVEHSDIWNTAGVVGETNISANPLFVGDGDYRLTATSPCIDVGTQTGAPAFDLDGNPRPVDGDGVSGAAVDLGAYERVP